MGDVVSGVGGLVTNSFEGGMDPFGQGAIKKGREAQTALTREANEQVRAGYERQLEYLKPWNDAGLKALSGMQDSDFSRDFTTNDFHQDPGYAFRMAEGQKAIERSASAKGGLNSGATMKSLARYGQDSAAQEYQSAYTRFNSDRDRRYGRLSTLAGMSQAQNQSGQAAGQYGMNLGNNLTGLGNATAGSYAAQGSANQKQTETGMSIASMAAGSDIRSKKNIREADAEIGAFLDGLKAYAYEYKDDVKNKPGYGHGEFISVMAQDLEKTAAGRSMVFDTPTGKMVDYAKAFGFMLAANVSMHERLKRLEEKEVRHAG